jgi:hypothetical protein
MYRSVEACQRQQRRAGARAAQRLMKHQPQKMRIAPTVRRARATGLELAGRQLALLAGATLGAAITLCCAQARACECIVGTPADAYKQADAVFEGRVRRVVQPPAGTEGLAAQKRVQLEVVRAWKGVRTEQVEVTTAADPAICGYDFAVEQSYFVYAVAQGDQLSVSLCSRTRPMAAADDDLHALGMGMTPVDPQAGTKDPSQKKAQQPPARGGCASCAVTTERGQPLDPALLLALWALAVRSGATYSQKSRSGATCRRRSGSRS